MTITSLWMMPTSLLLTPNPSSFRLIYSNFCLFFTCTICLALQTSHACHSPFPLTVLLLASPFLWILQLPILQNGLVMWEASPVWAKSFKPSFLFPFLLPYVISFLLLAWVFATDFLPGYCNFYSVAQHT